MSLLRKVSVDLVLSLVRNKVESTLSPAIEKYTEWNIFRKYHNAKQISNDCIRMKDDNPAKEYTVSDESVFICRCPLLVFLSGNRCLTVPVITLF